MDANLFLLPLSEWNALERPLDAEFNEWLIDWGKDERKFPAMDDVRRGLTRYGHYLGWIAARKSASPAP